MIIILNVNVNYYEGEEFMIELDASTKIVKVCVGPGCRAWCANKALVSMISSVRESKKDENIKIVPVPCMKKCGGGVSVATSSKLLKLREPEVALASLT